MDKNQYIQKFNMSLQSLISSTLMKYGYISHFMILSNNFAVISISTKCCKHHRMDANSIIFPKAVKFSSLNFYLSVDLLIDTAIIFH